MQVQLKLENDADEEQLKELRVMFALQGLHPDRIVARGCQIALCDLPLNLRESRDVYAAEWGKSYIVRQPCAAHLQEYLDASEYTWTKLG
jgi:hypothetical protein